jgi:hypothetical protein
MRKLLLVAVLTTILMLVLSVGVSASNTVPCCS